MKQDKFGNANNTLDRGDGNYRLSTILAVSSTVLGFLALATAVWSIERAHWITPQPSLITTLVLAVVVGGMLSHRRVPAKLVIPVALVLGIPVVVWQTAQLFPGTAEISGLRIWWQTVTGYRLTENPIFFAMFLTLVTWLNGSVSLWYIVRSRNARVAVISGAVMLLVNLANLPREYYYFFALYFFFAVLLLAVTYLAGKCNVLITWKDKYVQQGMVYFSTAVILIAMTTAGVAYYVPEPPLGNLGIKIDTTSVGSTNVQKVWFNIFYSIQSKWNIARSREQETLLFQDPVDTNAKTYFVISSGSSDYWCTRRYDVYESWGWTSAAETGRSLPAGERVDYGETPLTGQPVTYTVENRSKTDVILSRGSFSLTDIPVDLFLFDGDTRELSPDIAAITSSRLLRPYQSYRVETYITEYTPEELAAAGDDYPDWVAARYLQLPDTLPERVGILSWQITSELDMPYAKVLAVKEYLRQFTYDQSVPAPPEGIDGVDYFLYWEKRGVCTHFASAMAVLLRSAGIPARISTGYLRGELDSNTGKYIIRGSNTHAWVEVYFPGYGWVPVEATPTGSPVTGGEVATGTGGTLSLSGSDELPWWMVSPASPSSQESPSSATYPKKTLPWPYIYGILGIILFIAVIFIAREFFNRWVSGVKRVEQATQAYDRMCYLAQKGKSGPLNSETPLEFSRRLAGYLPWQKEDIDTIITLYLNNRYSPRREIREPDRAKLQTAWVRLCPALIKHMLRLKQWFPLRYLLLRWVD
jgi:transglutaminase-like putative cysteine protease